MPAWGRRMRRCVRAYKEMHPWDLLSSQSRRNGMVNSVRETASKNRVIEEETNYWSTHTFSGMQYTTHMHSYIHYT